MKTKLHNVNNFAICEIYRRLDEKRKRTKRELPNLERNLEKVPENPNQAKQTRTQKCRIYVNLYFYLIKKCQWATREAPE